MHITKIVTQVNLYCKVKIHSIYFLKISLKNLILNTMLNNKLLLKITLVIVYILTVASFSKAGPEKIHPYLQHIISITNEMIPVYIVFNDHLTLKDFEDIAYDTPKKERRQIVISRLQNFSLNYQRNVRSYLDARTQSEAESIEHIWLINVISLKASTHIINELSNFTEIKQICYDPVFPVEMLLDYTQLASPFWIVAPEPGIVLMNADDCWALGNRGAGVLVGNSDDGFWWKHPDLVKGLWNNLGEDANGNGITVIIQSGTGSYFDPGDLNGIDDDENGKIDDLIGWDFTSNSYDITSRAHGSATLGHVVGDGTGGTATGVSPEAKSLIMPNRSGQSQQWSAFQYSVEKGADIITSSLSWKWYFDPKPDYSQFRLITDMSLAAGVIHTNSTSNDGNNQGIAPIPLNIATAGNCPPPWLHPDQTKKGNLSGAIGVGNVDVYTDIIVSSSPWGPSTWGNWYLWGPYNYPIDSNHKDYPYSYTPPVEPDSMGLLKPDVSAPGQNSISTYVSSGNGYGVFSGTSSATPHAAGCLALMLSINPEMLPADLDRVLELTSIEKGSPGKDERYGAGRIDALLATTSPSALVEGIFGGNNWFISNTIAPNDTAKELVGLKLKNITTPWIGSMKKFKFDVQGTATNSDVEKYRLFWDVNKNNVVDAGDRLLKEAPFNGLVQVSLDTIKFKVIDTARHVLLTIKTKPTAQSNRIIDLSMPDSSYIVSYYMTNAWAANFPFGNVIGEENNEVPLTFSLSQNYPNPFNARTIISYSLSKNSFVSVKVYDVLGREAAVLINNIRETGVHRIEFDANFYNGLSSGVYFYKIEASSPGNKSDIYFTDIKKMVLIK